MLYEKISDFILFHRDNQFNKSLFQFITPVGIIGHVLNKIIFNFFYRKKNFHERVHNEY